MGSAAISEPTQSEPTVLVRKLGSSPVPTYLERVLTDDGEQRFVVVERFARGGMTDEEAADAVRDARIAAECDHPNIVRTRGITVRRDEIAVMCEYVAGERLADLWSATPTRGAAIPLGIALRILIDAASGAGALHKLRTEGDDRTKLVHGELTADHVLVGLDGISLVLRAARVRRPGVFPSGDIGCLAPEVGLGAPLDQRADVFSLGALLWQALVGRPRLAQDDVPALLASSERGNIARSVAKKHTPWALPLLDVAGRALASSPEKRFPTASSMVTELRRIAGAKLATTEDVAAFVEAAAGVKIASRIADVQESAVVRKATSIAPPRSLPPSSPTPSGSAKPSDDRDRLVEEAAVATTLDATAAASVPSTSEVRVAEPMPSPIATERMPLPNTAEPPTLAPTLAPALAAPVPPVQVGPPTAPQISERAPRPSGAGRAPSAAVRAAPVRRVVTARKVLPATPPASPFAALRQNTFALWLIGIGLCVALITGILIVQALRARRPIETSATSAPAALPSPPSPLEPASAAPPETAPRAATTTSTTSTVSSRATPSPTNRAPKSSTPRKSEKGPRK